MNAWIETWNAAAATWFDLLGRASWQGGVALAVVWLISRFVSRIPPACKVWLWRLAFLKLLAALVWLTPIALPVLPREGQGISLVEPALPVASIIHETTLENAPTFHTVAEPPTLEWRVWLLAAWCAGLLWCAAHLVSHWREARRLIAGAPLLRNAVVEEIVKSLQARFGLRTTPLVRESSLVSSPILVGLLRPHIILPDGMADSASPSRLELMLAHELAHCRRKDLLWLWLFTVAEALFFFHPLVWLARREWALATEAACDELALRVTRDAPREYGEMLVDLIAAARQRSNATGLIAVGMIENANTLKRRLKVMITTRTRLGTMGGIALIAIAAVTLAPWELTAQDADAEAVAKLKEENAKLRQELEAARKDAEKMRADTERLRNPATADRQNEAALQRAMAEMKAEVDREQARQVERDQRQKERFRADQQRVMEEVQAQLQELRTQFTENHPRVRAAQARLETLEAMDTALGGATRDRKRRALLQQEIELVERQVEMVRKGVEDRTQSSAALVAAQRELLEVKLQMAKLSASKDAARAELRQQLELAEGMLKEHKKLAEARLASPSDELALQREVLRIKRQLHELEASDRPE
jgi:beta-lactamase regulating signal transducer with metallopeptidase domain